MRQLLFFNWLIVSFSSSTSMKTLVLLLALLINAVAQTPGKVFFNCFKWVFMCRMELLHSTACMHG